MNKKNEVLEYYGDETFNKFLTWSEKNKINGFSLPTLTKKELLVVLADIWDTYTMGIESIEEHKIKKDELESIIDELNKKISMTNKSETSDSSDQSIQYNQPIETGVNRLNDKNGLYRPTDWN